MRPHTTFTKALAGALTAAALTVPAASAQSGPPTWPEYPEPIQSSRGALQGPPTWPMHPQRVDAAGAPDDGTTWPTLALGIAGAVVTAGASAFVGVRRRWLRSPKETIDA
jgi:hypothetical protein